MKATNSMVRQENGEKKLTFSAAITGTGLQNLIKKSVPDAASAARFTGAMVSAVAQNENLQKCNPATVVAAALRGEGMGLSIGTGYYLVPYGDKCTFILSYKGMIQLALGSGDIADIDVVEVREGEIVGRDKRTKRLQFDFSVYETEEEMNQHPVVGYYAYCEMKSGYFRYEYMSMADIMDHAKRYSKSFNQETYQKLQNGEFSPEQAERIRSTSPWYSSPDAMFKKTVMRKLLNSGFVPLANSVNVRDTLAEDAATESGDILPNVEVSGGKETVVDAPNFKVDDTTGEVTEEPPVSAQEPFKAEVVQEPTQEQKRAVGRPRKGQATPTVEQEPMEDLEGFSQEFFGGLAE